MDSDLAFLSGTSPVVARQLIGWRFYRREHGQLVGGVIIETEAYMQTDAASHSYRGRTPRTDVMFGPAGHLYVYFTYGMHYCVNIVTSSDGTGEAVLLRAICPDAGLNIIRRRRLGRPYHELTDGPAKLCQALGIDRADHGKRLNDGEFLLLPPEQGYDTIATQRIGITRDTHRLWRFVAAA
jgi:DNA-3-methyladenine glycosylase